MCFCFNTQSIFLITPSNKESWQRCQEKMKALPSLRKTPESPDKREWYSNKRLFP
jgi:hypothetical protein